MAISTQTTFDDVVGFSYWSNETNALDPSDSNWAVADFATVPSATGEIRFDTLSTIDSEVPDDATIDDIDVTIRIRKTEDAGSFYTDNLRIFGGSYRTNKAITTTWQELNFGGPPVASWGITNAQALEFISGSRFLTFIISASVSSVLFVQVAWVKVQITYTPNASVKMPVVF